MAPRSALLTRHARATRRALMALAVMVTLLHLTGCGDDERKPIPIIEVGILADDGAYLFNQQRMTLTQLKSELRHIADDTRRPITNTCRAYIRLNTATGASPERTDEVVHFCMSVGLDKIENLGSGN